MSVRERRRLRRTLGAALGLVLVTAAAPAYGVDRPAATTDGPQSEGERALVKAADTGAPVEVVGERSEFTTTYANPDGATFRLEQSAVPVRVKTESGSWVTPDPTLVMRPDGTVGPKAAIVGLSFSGGGAASDLVTMEREGRTLGLGWQKPLPRPTLDGASATYPEVLPGVDLRMTATTEGFRDLLVVKTPEAAANPALKEIEFGLKANGLEVSGSKQNGLTAWNSDGQTVFQAPPALMWDSSGPDAPPVQPTAKKAAAKAAVGAAKAAPTAEADAGDSPFDGPGHGDRKAALPLEVDDKSLTVVPDPALLAQRTPAAFPLYIDPSFSADDSVERTLLRSDGYENWGWGNGDDDLGKGMGKCGSWAGYYCGPGYVQRLYFQFTPEKLRGKRIVDATFRVAEPWAFQCEPRNVWLVKTAGRITKSTTWANKPGYADRLGDRWVSAGRGSLCDPDKPKAYIEFNDNPDETDENLTPTVQAWAKGTAPLTLELRAEDESDTSEWKRFRNDAVLNVQYMSDPAVPTDQEIDGHDCETDPDDATTVSHEKPVLSARPQVVRGGENGASLSVAFLLERKNGSSWVSVLDNPFVEAPSGHDAKPNSRQTVQSGQIPNLKDGELYRIRTWTRSYASQMKTTGSDVNDAPTCYFRVDLSAPEPPVITFKGPYSACDVACFPAGRPGQAGAFTFRPAAGDDNIASYHYKLSTDTRWRDISAKADMPVKLTPQTSGLVSVRVRARDSVGNGRLGEEAKVSFMVQEDPDPVAHWNFTTMDGEDAADTASHDISRDPADLRNGASRPDDGRRGWLTDIDQEDRALKLDGVDDYAVTEHSVLDTRKSYTIAGWVRPDRVDDTFSMVGIAGEHSSAVSVTHHSGGEWSARLASADGSEDFIVEAKTKTVPKVWTHVAVVYDEGNEMDMRRKVSLYLNGVPQGSTIVDKPLMAATGPLTLGRIKSRDEWVSHFAGLIDEVTVWQAPLIESSVRAAARLGDRDTDRNRVELSARWNPDLAVDGVGVVDTSGYDRTLSLTSGASIAGGKLVLNGTSGSGWADGPLVDELGSFTATIEAELDDEKLVDKPDGYVAQLLGQRTSSGAAWGVWFKKFENVPKPDKVHGGLVMTAQGRWYFGRLNADGTGTWVQSKDYAVTDESVQLTVVQDVQGQKLQLYVDGRRDTEREGYQPVETNATTFAVGKGLVKDEWSRFLPGRINDVRLWSGAMRNPDQVQDFT
ncbi:LamG-like jellyroll fold domain-containing protein [Streptomyces sp. NPDC089919]|uniref:LamG-like jellyroll fold domain-containing protein n=1 Tax=Streptomyces sp. NPDC089919 TaxID=3155188 RepID=UPI0034294781